MGRLKMPIDTKVAKISDVPPGQCKTVSVNGTDVALYNVGGTFYATANACPHRGGSLGEGLLEDRLITCPWHGWQFDVTTGCLVNNPQAKVQTYTVQVNGDDVVIALADKSAEAARQGDVA
jgi:nitrite reductase/ring-hydroxylating ferredoxin subunit